MKKSCLFIFVVIAVQLSTRAKGDGDQPVTGTAPQPSKVLAGQKIALPPKIQASLADNQITLSDGRTFKVLKSVTKSLTPQLVMNSPIGATVTITYEDGKDIYTGKIPFIYEVPVTAKNSAFFKVTVDEGGPEKTWSVILQHGINYIITIQ